MRCKGTTIFCICKIFRQKNTLFLAFFLKIIGFSYIFTQTVISTLQNDRLNRGYYLLLYVLPYLCTFAAVFLIMYVCAYLIYREKPKTLLFDVCSRFPSYMYVCTIFRFRYVCSRLFDTFQLSRLFLNKVWCLVFRFVFTRFLFHENCA